MGLRERFKNAWNIFRGRSPTGFNLSGGSGFRPDRLRMNIYGLRSVVTSAYTQIAVDCSSMDIRHVKVDEEGNYKETVKDTLNYALTKSANLDQTGRELIKDAILKMFDYGCVAIVPVDADLDPGDTNSYEIYQLRAGKIVEWYPKHVSVELYDENTGEKKTLTVEKRYTVIVENPFYPIMNEPNSTAQRLISTLNKLDDANENQTGKVNLIFQLPYEIKDTLKQMKVNRRRKELERQMDNNPYGIWFIDSSEKVIQLNRQVENNLWEQAKDLKTQLFNELGFSMSIFDGTADEKTMLNYQNRTLEPILTTLVENMERKWLTLTAQSQGHAIKYFSRPFKLVPVAQIAEIADKFTRNEIMTSNEIRAVIGMQPVDDPKANELRNANLNHPDEEGTTSTVVDEVIEHHGVKGQHWGVKNGPPYPLKENSIRRHKIEDGGYKYTATDEKGKIISEIKGYDFKIKDFDWILISDVETNPESRGKGLATKLINRLYDDVNNETDKGVYLLVKKDNYPAISLYNKLNFDTIKEYKLKSGQYYVMAKGNADKDQLRKMNFS